MPAGVIGSSLKKYGFHEWSSKTYFSFLNSTSAPEELISQAINNQYQSLNITDFDGVYGLARSFQFKKNLKLHYSAEIHLKEDHDEPLYLRKTIILLAPTLAAYQELCSVLSFMHKERKTKAFIALSDLYSLKCDHLVCLIPQRSLLAYKEIKDLRTHFQNRIYLLLTRTLHPSNDHRIPTVFESSHQLRIPWLISQDTFMTTSHQKKLHDTLMAIQHNLPLEEAEPYFLPNGEHSLHTLEFIDKVYSPLPGYKQALYESHLLANSCMFCLSELKYHYPQELIPPGHTSTSFLEKLVWEGFHRRQGNSEIKQLVEKELELIRELEFEDYFLTVWDIVAWAREQKILCQGRGSAANSAVCYYLGITAVNPLQFDLLFERFINKERGDPPDIDVDFEHERREEVIQYIYSRYGRDRAAMVANVITFKRKGAIRAVGKALGISEIDLSRASKLLSSKNYRGQDFDSIFEVFSKKLKQSNIDFETWKKLSLQLKGFPRHLGIHSGGFLLSNQNLDLLIPREPATMEGRTVIQWSKEDIEHLGFFKIDILALGMLSALRKTFQTIPEHYPNAPKDLRLYQIPHDDAKTYHMISQADTVGVFQIESRAQMSMLPRLRPRCFYDLVIEIAIIRPGPIQGKIIHPYLKRRNGLLPITYAHPKLKPILNRTLGVAVFQEQVMRIAIALGDFTPGEANELRKNIGTWNVKSFERNLNPWLDKLKDGLVRHHISQDFIDEIMGQMKGFAHYGFPESHAISFAFLAYASSYLKCHYPAAFFMGILNSQPMGFYSPHALLQAARRAGVKLLPICVHSSHWDHTLEANEQNPNSPHLRLGMRLIRHLSQSVALNICSYRNKHGQWKSLDHFLSCQLVHRDDFTALAAANAFTCFNVERVETLWQGEALPRKPLIDGEERKIDWDQDSPIEEQERDFAAFGTSLLEHPTTLIRKHSEWPYELNSQWLKNSVDLKRTPNHSLVHCFGLVLILQAPPSAKGMVFVTLEDEWGYINLAFAPQIYRKFHQLIDQEVFLMISGRLQKPATNAQSILVKKVHAKRLLQIPIRKNLHTHDQKVHSINKGLSNSYGPSSNTAPDLNI